MDGGLTDAPLGTKLAVECERIVEAELPRQLHDTARGGYVGAAGGCSRLGRERMQSTCLLGVRRCHGVGGVGGKR